VPMRSRGRLQPQLVSVVLWLSILVTIRASQSVAPSWAPQGNSSISPPAPSRAVVMCAYDGHTLRLAWTQIMALRELYGMGNETFLIYHADELTRKHDRAVRRLEALPHVHVRNLRPWHHRVLGDKDFARFQGFLCKPAALLASEQDVIVLLDLDAVLLENPFALLRTPIYEETGSYLFTDRRWADMRFMEDGWAKTIEDWAAMVEAMWALRRAGEPLPEVLRQSPLLTGYSKETGESAVVLYDKARSPEAVEVLLWLLDPAVVASFESLIYGDKELFWLSFALAGRPYGANPYRWAAVGFKHKGRLCELSYILAQYVRLPGDAQPRPFYLNGDGVENAVMEADLTDLKGARIARPRSYYQNSVGFCQALGGDTPLEDDIIRKVRVFARAYQDRELRSRITTRIVIGGAV
jgi:hypothetical protein